VQAEKSLTFMFCVACLSFEGLIEQEKTKVFATSDETNSNNSFRLLSTSTESDLVASVHVA